MCSNAKQARSCRTPACVSIITSAVIFTARLSAGARARRDDRLLVISKPYTEVLNAGKAGWLARQGARPPPVLLRSFRFPALVKRARKIVGCNQWRRQTPPCYHGFRLPTHGVLQTLIGLFLFRAFLTCQRTMRQGE